MRIYIAIGVLLAALLIALVVIVHRAQTDHESPTLTSAASAQRGLILPDAPALEGATRSITQVYANSFDNPPVGPGWSRGKIVFTKKGNRPYLGDFKPNKPVTLSLAGLPPHKLLRISFDLLVMRSWDGSSQYYGATIFDLKLGSDRSLIHTTFGNCGFFPGNNEQAFPDTYPCRPYSDWTGAREFMTLGTMQSWGRGSTYDTSSVYHLTAVCPHSEDSAVFSFASTMSHDLNKPFGLSNVKVETITEFVPRSESVLAELWSDLGSAQYPIFYDAGWKLVESGDAAVAFLTNHIHESCDLTQDQMQEVYTRYEETGRSELLRVLEIQGKAAEPVLSRQIMGKTTDGQVIYGSIGVKQCLSMIERYPQSATDLRLARLRQVLQIIHTEAAMKLLDQATTQPITPSTSPAAASRLNDIRSLQELGAGLATAYLATGI